MVRSFFFFSKKPNLITILFYFEQEVLKYLLFNGFLKSKLCTNIGLQGEVLTVLDFTQTFQTIASHKSQIYVFLLLFEITIGKYN